MALPIFAIYMNKIYATPELGYTQQDQFDLPIGFNPCGSEDDMTPVDEEQEGHHTNIGDLPQ